MKNAYLGSLVADAFSMPVHWYYDREAMDTDYPNLKGYTAPLPEHSGSILWRSHYDALNEKGDILHDQARFWGVRGVHYHQNLSAGENTVNFKLARELHQQVRANDGYSADAWLELYIEKMLTPGWHGDTYLEEYHRAFFTRYSRGKAPRKCGIEDEHIGGLSQVTALAAALENRSREEIRETVKAHVSLTHRHAGVLRAADCLAQLLLDQKEGIPLREALQKSANDWFSTRKAMLWEKRADREVIGRILSPACYINESFPAALYLAWKYHDDFGSAIIANAKVGGDSCHRGTVVGSLCGLSDPQGVQSWLPGLLAVDVT